MEYAESMLIQTYPPYTCSSTGPAEPSVCTELPGLELEKDEYYIGVMRMSEEEVRRCVLGG